MGSIGEVIVVLPECDPLLEAVEEVIRAHPAMVQRWAENQSGAWGFLAGQGILAYRRRLGRRLTETERRGLWHALWTTLEARKGGDGETAR